MSDKDRRLVGLLQLRFEVLDLIMMLRLRPAPLLHDPPPSPLRDTCGGLGFLVGMRVFGFEFPESTVSQAGVFYRGGGE